MFPKTFVTILGFMLVSAFIIGQISTTTTNLNQGTSNLQTFSNTTQQAVNSTDSQQGIYDRLTGVLGIAWGLIGLMYDSIVGMITVSTMTPPFVSLILWVLIIFGIVAVIKVLWWGE